MEVVAAHPRVSPHATTTTAEEGLENAVWIHVVEAATATIFNVLPAVIHPPLLFIAQYCISFSHLHHIQYMKILH